MVQHLRRETCGSVSEVSEDVKMTVFWGFFLRFDMVK